MKKYRIALALACLSGLGLSFLSGCMDENLASFANLTLRCTGNDLEQYVAGEWVLKTKCEAPAKCDKLSIGSYGCIAGEDTEIPELPACDPHDGTYKDGRKCNANRTGGFTCSQDRTLEMFTCKTGEHCNLSTFECLSDAEAFEALANETCEAGSKLCHENALVLCGDDGHWDIAKATFCANDEVCIDGDFLNGCFCLNDAFRCEDNTPVRCVDYEWQKNFYNCGDDYICSEAVKDCVKTLECSGNSIRCEQNGSPLYYVCTDEHYWSATPETCPDGQVCSDGACRETDDPVIGDYDECSEKGKTICRSANTYSTCVKAMETLRWTAAEPCPDDQICKDNACTDPVVVIEDPECDNGKAICEGNNVRACVDGKLGTPTPCGEQTCVNGTCTTVHTSETGQDCEGNVTQCAADGSGLITCIDEEWSEITLCGSGMKCDGDRCITDTSATECWTGERRCDTTASVAKYQVCTNGVWGSSKSCSRINQVCYQGDCYDCVPGSTKCGGLFDRDYVMKCRANGSGYDRSGNKCTLGCNEGACRTCSDGDVQCSDDSFQGCSDGAWTELARCDSADSCSDSGCGCTKGEMKCDADGNILECQENNVLGSRNKKYTAWVVKTSCGGADLCETTDDGPTCACHDDATRCSEDGTNVEICHNGAWSTSDACGNQNMKCSEGDSGAECVCNSGDFYCPTLVSSLASSVRYYCDGTTWNTTDYGCESGLCNADLGNVCVTTQCSALNVEGISSTALALLGLNTDDIGSKCNGADLMTCSGGLYTVKAHCQSGCESESSRGIDFAYCRSYTSGCGVLNINDVRCGANNMSIEKCKYTGFLSITWATEATCDYDEICIKNGSSYSCVEKTCEPDTFSCDGTKIQQCINNDLVDVADCADSNLVCKGGVCVKS